MKTITTLIERPDSTWEPQCVYWSESTGDLLVGIYREQSIGIVARYNRSGQLTKTIEQDNKKLKLYSVPKYITENNNGDVLVSVYDASSGAVVVTERGGRHRFTYTGDPSGSEFQPRGVCTDALSHILVCDDKTSTVHMTDKDGHFLLHLVIRPSEVISPLGLSYDVNTHCLWVGSRSRYHKVIAFKYITRKDALTGMYVHYYLCILNIDN